MTDLVVREVGDADVEAVVALWDRCGLLRPHNDPRADIAQAIASGAGTVLAGFDGDRLAAALMAGFEGHRGWLYYVGVDPAGRGRGFGRAVIAAAEDWLRARGARKVQLLVRPTNRGVLGFYEALGYADQHLVVMGRWLDGTEPARFS